MPTDSYIDERILFFARPQWLKVARVLGDVNQECAQKNIQVSEEQLQTRLEALIAAERLEAAGNVANWRYSEVRLPSAGIGA